VRGAGLNANLPSHQQMVRVSLRTVTMQIPSQKSSRRINVSIDIAAVAYYHISDPEKAVIVIENVYNAINQISRRLCAMSSDDSVSMSYSRTPRASTCRSRTSSMAHGTVGHTVTAVEIKDIILPTICSEQWQRKRGERERRAKIVAAKGIPSCGEARQAADIITQHPVALQLRTLQTMAESRSKELDHHFPRTIYDDGAGSLCAQCQRFSIKVALRVYGVRCGAPIQQQSGSSRTRHGRRRSEAIEPEQA